MSASESSSEKLEHQLRTGPGNFIDSLPSSGLTQNSRPLGLKRIWPSLWELELQFFQITQSEALIFGCQLWERAESNKVHNDESGGSVVGVSKSFFSHLWNRPGLSYITTFSPPLSHYKNRTPSQGNQPISGMLTTINFSFFTFLSFIYFLF